MRPESTRFSLSRFLHARPWIWIVLFYCLFVAAMLSFVILAVRNRDPSVPLNFHGR